MKGPYYPLFLHSLYSRTLGGLDAVCAILPMSLLTHVRTMVSFYQSHYPGLTISTTVVGISICIIPQIFTSKLTCAQLWLLAVAFWNHFGDVNCLSRTSDLLLLLNSDHCRSWNWNYFIIWFKRLILSSVTIDELACFVLSLMEW